MQTRISTLHLVALFALGFASGCGPGFDPASEVKTLRVFGVQKDVPYANPGQDVTLNLLWQDAKPVQDASAGGRPVQVAWVDCTNPANDLYAGCFSADRLTMSTDTGSTHHVTIPNDIIRTHAPATPGNPSYGLMYSFFAVCAGTLSFEAPKDGAGLPVFCKDGEKYLGPDDFVAGYTALYVFEREEVQNQNPLVTGLTLEQTEFASQANDPASPACVGTECAANATAPSIDCALPENESRCFPACADDGGEKCPDIHIKPLVDPSSAERDDVSFLYYGRNFKEQMWVNYYASGGKFVSDTRLLNDAQRGWNQDYGAKFRAPKTPGTVTLWAVVHDNRGGVAWTSINVGIY
jgi:hypothetical protein